MISGVTTNPSLAASAGIGDREAYRSAVAEIATLVEGPISVEVVSTDTQGMVEEGRDIANWIPDPWVKIPSTIEGIEAIATLSGEGIRVNQTLCFSVNQALLGAQAGATVVSPFIGRLDDIGQDGIGLIRDIATLFRGGGIETQVMAASVRHPLHCVRAAEGWGAHRDGAVQDAAADGAAPADGRGAGAVHGGLAAGVAGVGGRGILPEPGDPHGERIEVNMASTRIALGRCRAWLQVQGRTTQPGPQRRARRRQCPGKPASR